MLPRLSRLNPSCRRATCRPLLSSARHLYSAPPPISASRSILRRRKHTYEALDGDQSDPTEFGAYDVILPEEPYVWGVDHIESRTVPNHIRRPHYAMQPTGEEGKPEPYSGDGLIGLGSEDERRLRKAARLASEVRDYAGTLVKPGVTTNAIDSAVHEYIVKRKAYPSPLLYSGFPRSCCTSVNNIVAHGIPDDRPLQDGDIVNVDVTVYLDGFHGDTSDTFLVGDVDDTGRALVSATTDALEAGIAACKPGAPFTGIARAIHDHVLASKLPHIVCQSFTGHGIGREFHRPPWIFHTLNEEPGIMQPGHCFTIEPCLIQGSNPRIWIFPDGWTASTENCARSAQAEHMVLITEDGAEVLTR